METAFAELAREGHELAVNLSAGAVTLSRLSRTAGRASCRVDPVGRRSGRAAAYVPAVSRSCAGCRCFGASGATQPRGPPGCASPSARFDRAIERRAGRLTPTVRVEREPRADAMAELVARLPYDGRIRHVRDARYLAWRYRNPLRDYRFLYRDGAGLAGLPRLAGRPVRPDSPPGASSRRRLGGARRDGTAGAPRRRPRVRGIRRARRVVRDGGGADAEASLGAGVPARRCARRPRAAIPASSCARSRPDRSLAGLDRRRARAPRPRRAGTSG